MLARTTLILAGAFWLNGLSSPTALAQASFPSASSEENPKAAVRTQPLSPAESQSQIVVPSGGRPLLLAAEPLVIDPVECVFDDAGRCWIVEMHDYPSVREGIPQGRIRVLSDSDGDGNYDTSRVFADQLNMPTGIALWKNGALVTVAGQLLWLADLDQNGAAEHREVWLTGFSESNEQLRANHPRLGPDGWWYIACGLRGGSVALGEAFRGRAAEAPSAATTEPAPLNVGSRDIRLHAQSGRLEAVTGPAQFGLAFDQTGKRFFCSNRNPCVQVVFEQQALTGNPLTGLLPSTVDVLPAGTASRVFPLVSAWTTSNLHGGQFTAACGVFLRHRAHSGRESAVLEDVFVCEPTGSLVKRQTVGRGIAHLEVQQTDSSNKEWLASRDSWFRPVNICLAPNNSLVVVDMHRAVIEHPRWMPDELKERPDMRWGDKAGRLFAIQEEAHDSLVAVLQELRLRPLHQRSTPELTALVARGNQWNAETAFRLLIERDATDAVGNLIALALDESIGGSGKVRCVQLATILGNRFPQSIAQHLVEQEEIETPAFAIGCLQSARHANFDSASWRQFLSDRSAESDAIAFEALLSLSTLSDVAYNSETVRAVAQADSPLLLVATAGAFKNSPEPLFADWIDGVDGSKSDPQTLVAAAQRLVNALPADAHSRAMQKLLANFSRNSATSSIAPRLAAIDRLLTRSPKLKNSHPDLWALMRGLLEDEARPLNIRRLALQILSHSPIEDDQKTISGLAQSDSPLCEAALSAWSNASDPDCDAYLIELITSGNPQLRQTVIQLLSARKSRLELLCTELTEGRVSPKLIGATSLKQLVSKATGDTRGRLQSHLDSILDGDRKRVVSQYRDALKLVGNEERGRSVFKQHCANCHQIDTLGRNIGPDISDSRTKQPEQLLTSILDPNAAIDNNYFRFLFAMNDGTIQDGIVVDETADSIVIVNQQAQRVTLPRSELEQSRPTGTSLMPDGFESQISVQEMADLLRFIKRWRYLDGAIPFGETDSE